MLVLINNLNTIRELINKLIKINTRIYQQKWANKGHNR